MEVVVVLVRIEPTNATYQEDKREHLADLLNQIETDLREGFDGGDAVDRDGNVIQWRYES
jgi:hypothetical protein